MTPPFAHLTDGTVSLVLALDIADGPRVLHWGAPLGALDDAGLAALAPATTPRRSSAPSRRAP